MQTVTATQKPPLQRLIRATKIAPTLAHYPLNTPELLWSEVVPMSDKPRAGFIV